MSTSPRFTKLSAQGAELPADASPEQVAGIHVNATGRVIAAMLLNDGETATHQQALDLARGLDHMGHLDWELITVADWDSIKDLTRCEPACDPDFFPFIKRGWAWCQEKTAWASSYAWCVGLNGGDSYFHFRYYHGLVLAVRSARASQ